MSLYTRKARQGSRPDVASRIFTLKPTTTGIELHAKYRCSQKARAIAFLRAVARFNLRDGVDRRILHRLKTGNPPPTQSGSWIPPLGWRFFDHYVAASRSSITTPNLVSAVSPFTLN